MDLTKCTEKITKIAENHVIVEYVLYDSKGVEIVVDKKEYGQNAITEKKTNAQAEYDKWDSMSTEDITAKKAEAQAKIDKANALQTEMDKEISVTE